MNYTRSVLIVGGSGFVGSHLALKLREHYKVFATYFKNPLRMRGVTFLPMNIDNRNWVKRIIYTVQPDVVIYAAGSNQVDSSRWGSSRQIEHLHAVGPAHLAGATEMIQPRFIYISNPYVFDGAKGNYHENDIVLPSTVLGRMKLGGENVIKSKCLNYIIIRSSPLYGRGVGNNPSFLDHLRMSLDREKRIELSTQELHSFAPIEGFSNLMIRLLESGVRNRILHYGGLTKINHLEFGQFFAQYFGYNPNLIVPKHQNVNKNTGQSNTKVKLNSSMDDRATDFSLNSSQINQTLKLKSFILEEGFDLIQKELIPKL